MRNTERTLAFEPLEPRQMLSTASVAGPQLLTAASVDAVLRSAPVTLLAGSREFGGAGSVETVADGPVFTEGSFALEADVRPNAIKSQTLISKYESGRGDMSFELSMLGDGRLQFDVYGNPPGQSYRVFRTFSSPLKAGEWQKVAARFDVQSGEMSILVNGQQIPGTVIAAGPAVTALYDGTVPVRLGVEVAGGGPGNYFSGGMTDVRFYPVDSYGIPDPPAATAEALEVLDAVMTEAGTDAPGAESDRASLGRMERAVLQTLQELLTEDGAEPSLLGGEADFAGMTITDGAGRVALPGVGGTADVMSWQGASGSGTGLTAITGDRIRRALIGAELDPERVKAEPALSAALGMPAGMQRDPATTDTHTLTLDGREMGRMTISVYDGRHARSLYNRNGLLGGWEDGKAFGQTDMSITFRDGPRYVQWIDLKFTTGRQACSVYVEDADGNGSTITAAGDGPVVIDREVRVIALFPGNESGVALRAIETERPAGAAEARAETWVMSQGALLGVDLHNAGGAVDAADLWVLTDRPGTRVIAHVYRGDTEVATQDVPADGKAHVETEGGFTGIFLEKSDPTATLTVRSLAVRGRSGAAPLPADAPTPLNNRTVAMLSAPVWEHPSTAFGTGGTFNWQETQARAGVMGERGGYENHVNGSVLFAPGMQTSPTQYTRFDLRAMSGDLSIFGVLYTDSDGLHPMPAGWYRTILGKTLILAPGGPKHVVLQITGNGTFGIGHAAGDRASEITPSQEMALRSTVSVVRKAGAVQGFVPHPASVSSTNERARAGETVNVLFGIHNDGMGAGSMTARIRVGQTGTTEDPVVRTFTGTIKGMESVGLSADVRLEHDYDIASLEVISPDGRSSMAGWTVRPPSPSTGSSLTEEQKAERTARAGRLREEALAVGTDPRARANLVASVQTNIQRERQTAVANGVPPPAVTQARVDEETEKELVAMAGGVDATGLVHALGTVSAQEGKTGIAALILPQRGSQAITFTLQGPMMANLWTDFGPDETGQDDKVGLSYGLSVPQYPDLSLTLTGNGIEYVADHRDAQRAENYLAGESVSSVLPAGTYTLTVKDCTQYPDGASSVSMPTVPVHYELLPYKTQKITGRVSIPERPVTMPVSMSVAEFDPATGLRLPIAKNALDPQKPVWVVVHGRANNENSSHILELTKNLQALGEQVATVDWHDGAADNATPIGLGGARWIEAVGAWTASQLQAAGFGFQNICVVGHSWGTYVAYEIGKQTPGGMRTLIALDPAADSKLLGGGKYKGMDDPQFSFSQVATNSYAFHSSEFGDRAKALTAEYAFSIMAPENYERSPWDTIAAKTLASQHYLAALGMETVDEVLDAYHEHGFAVSLFSELLRRQKEVVNNPTANLFSIASLLSADSAFSVRPDHWEGVFCADPELTTYTEGSDSGTRAWTASSFQFYTQDSKGNSLLIN